MQDLTTFLTQHTYLSATAAFIILLVAIIEWLRLKRLNFAINPTRVTQLINRENAIIIDIRPRELYAKGF